MLKKLTLFICVIVLGSSCQTSNFSEKAENALDGGRYFIENYHQGDMKMAHAFMVEDAKNQAYFDEMSKAYFSLDKENRQQLRQSSIQINEVKTIDPKTTVIIYSNSTDQIQRWLKVILTADGWKVDLKYSYGPKL
ncbi:MAG: hypothetical protein RI940_1169 [Bacteroidota bacterium]|jgi:hypothetical protein